MLSEQQLKKLQKIRLLVMDVDGTLTDGAMYYTEQGEFMKRFSTRDGMGITLLRRSGIDSAILTSENSIIAVRRAEKLGIKTIVLGSRNKMQSFADLAAKLTIPLDHIAYIGDDINDLPCFSMAGFAACPSDSVQHILDAADYICSKPGGHGAVRELCELILVAQDKPIVLPENW
jgi:YrbI family 3-deoxy-D-manno-octulosonate 8-phosphate phosphatase